jgi:hypothetical protein
VKIDRFCQKLEDFSDLLNDFSGFQFLIKNKISNFREENVNRSINYSLRFSKNNEKIAALITPSVFQRTMKKLLPSAPFPPNQGGN